MYLILLGTIFFMTNNNQLQWKIQRRISSRSFRWWSRTARVRTCPPWAGSAAKCLPSVGKNNSIYEHRRTRVPTSRSRGTGVGGEAPGCDRWAYSERVRRKKRDHNAYLGVSLEVDSGQGVEDRGQLREVKVHQLRLQLCAVQTVGVAGLQRGYRRLLLQHALLQTVH